MCQTRKESHTELYDHVWGYLACSMHTLFCNPVGCVECYVQYPVKCLLLRWWQLACTSLFSDEVICTTCIVICIGCSREVSVLLSSEVLQHIQTCFLDISYVPHIFTNKWWMSIGVIPFTFINCFTLHTSTFIRVFSRWFEMRTVPSGCCMMTQDNIRVPVTWWNLWSDDATAHETSYCLIFWKFLVCEIQGK